MILWRGPSVRLLMAAGLFVTGTAVMARGGPAEAVDTGGGLVSVLPARLLDTRPGELTYDGLFQGRGRVGPDHVIELQVAGRGGVPSDAEAAMLNVTAVNPDTAGFVTVFPCGQGRPLGSNLNYEARDVVPNLVFAKIGSGGKTCVFTLANTDLVADVTGFVPAGGGVASMLPVRLLDTRSGETTHDGAFQGRGRPGAGSVIELQVAGRGGVPSDAEAVMLNVTAVRPDAAGFVTVFPCGQDRPVASNLNYVAADVIPNLVFAKIGAAGNVCVFTLANTDLVADVMGFAPAGGGLTSLVPARVLDTRAGEQTDDGLFQGLGRPGVNSVVEFQVAGRGGVPSGAQGVMLNVTVVDPDAAGHATVYPCGETRPVASNLNYVAGDVVPNLVFAKVGAGGRVCVFTLADTDVVVDITGYTSTCPVAPVLVNSVVSSVECEALVALYNATGGPNWHANTGWNTRVDPCTWHGITCDSLGVARIHLSSNNLTGAIPSEIGNLSNLSSLGLGNNRLTSVPPEIGNLNNLEYLHLDFNRLTSLPAEVGNLTGLTHLVLYFNQLTSLPAEIGNLTKLTVLYVSGNQLTGLPSEIGNLTNLTEFWLAANLLTNLPAEIGNLTKLSSFSPSENRLTSLPPEIGNLTSLTRLGVGENRLTSLPPQIGNLANLTELWLGANRLTSLPPEIGNLTKLTLLGASGNRLTSLPPEIGNLTKLEILRLDNNQLGGDVTGIFAPLMFAGTLSGLSIGMNDCLSTLDPLLAVWLTSLDPFWDDGCP